jgi:hypothetical protein
VINTLPTSQSRTGFADFRTGHLSTEGEECSGRPTQGTVPENVDAIHSTILYYQRISAKKIAETLLIS